jgi:1-deoxy-D-xylulose-5-phosphate synthase
MSCLDKIQAENDIKKLDKSEYGELAEDIREFLIDKVSHKGGHLASNLGTVELTMALHLCMDFPKDKLIFDVGHQSYTHKLLTGRREGFDSLREYGGMSGFPKTGESDCDCFNTGHSSTSISAALGYAVARDLKGGDEKIAAVIGDGSLTGGMAYEALNSLSQEKTGVVIVLNDNEMSIDKNVGGLSKYLNEIRVSAPYNELKSGVENSLLSSKTGERVARSIKKSKDNIKGFFVPGMFFEELGITYVGPIDGHDTELMVKTLKRAFKLNRPIIIHVKTKKGKGYRFAEKHPDYFHGVNPFDKETGKVLQKKSTSSYTDIFSKHLTQMGEEHEDIVAITAAMSIGTGLNRFAEKFPDRFFDVGIAEQHAVTFAAGLAAAGVKPVVAVYSSFLQRAYDQILHDVCLQKLPVIFAVDRSGLVGKDGETHQGIYDTSFLSHMPGLVVMMPKNRYELMDMMDFAYSYDGPVAIKYSRGPAVKELAKHRTPIELNRSEIIYNGKDIAVIAVGNMMEEAIRLVDMLKADGINPTLVNARFVSAIDMDMLKQVCGNSRLVVTMEENISAGGYGESFAAAVAGSGCGENLKLFNVSIKTGAVSQGDVPTLRKMLRIDAESVYSDIKELI